MSVNYPIGARILSPEMMRCSFYHTEAVLETVKEIRTTAAKVNSSFNSALIDSPNEALMEARGYNNAISILGSRGSGKTSIIMTLQHILRVGEDAWKSEAKTRPTFPENIIMPILVPQDFSSGQPLLSWVIIQLLEKAEEIEREISSEGLFLYGNSGPFKRWISDKTSTFVRDPLRECMDSLMNSFELRYKSDINYNVCNDDDHVYKYMDEVRRDSKLALDMLKLISIMVDYYRYVFSRNGYNSSDSEKEPLFFFVIDDLDLAPERSHEVLNLVLRYLQHPNVVVLSGWNQELFQSHLCINLLKNQGWVDEKLLDTNFGYDDVFMKRQRKRIAALDSARRLAMDNLKKAFPPSQRFEIRSLSLEQRAFFPLVPQKTLDKSMEKCFMPLIESALGSVKAFPEGSVPFMHNYRGEYLQVYMRAFDNKARGMINVYNAFEKLRAHISNWNRTDSLELTPYLRSLLDTILFSNTRFFPYRRGIRDLVGIEKIVIDPNDSKKNICEFYCNYKSVGIVLRDYQNKIEHLRENDTAEDKYMVEREYNYFPTIIIDVLILLNFMGNMMRYLCGIPMFEHGGTEFSNALNEVNPPIDIVGGSDNLLACAIAVAGIERIALFPTTKGLSYFQKYYGISTDAGEIGSDRRLMEIMYTAMRDKRVIKTEFRLSPPKNNSETMPDAIFKSERTIKDDVIQFLKIHIFTLIIIYGDTAIEIDVLQKRFKTMWNAMLRSIRNGRSHVIEGLLKEFGITLSAIAPHRLGIVYHLIKSGEKNEGRSCFARKDNFPGLKAYEKYSFGKARFYYEASVSAISNIRDICPELSRLIVGIDAASLEIPTEPWVFAPAFREARKRNGQLNYSKTAQGAKSLLGVTYHVGEDFRHPLSGLRHIDEAIEHLQLRPGDRIGHGLALGIDLDQWFNSCSFVILPRIEWLENNLWIWNLISQKPEFAELSSFLGNIERNIMASAREIYGTSDGITVDSLFNAYQAKNLSVNEIRKKADAYIGVCNSRNDCFEAPDAATFFPCWNANQPAVPPTWTVDTMILSYHCGFYKHRMDENIIVQTDGTAELSKMLQKYLRKKISAIGIIVESNPSSNATIGEMDGILSHPAWNLRAGADKHVMISINTDDPSYLIHLLQMSTHRYIILCAIMV